MRTLLIGTLAVTLIGCSCVLPPQADLNGCSQTSGFPCPARTAEDKPIEPKPSVTKVHSARKETKPTPSKSNSLSAKTGSRAVTATAKSAVPVEDPPANQSAQTSDSIIAKAKVTIAAKMENPASADFQDMKRAIRTNTLRQNVDTICGHVKGRNASGEDTGEMPFLYLVKDDDAYVVNGGPETVAATAYRNICN